MAPTFQTRIPALSDAELLRYLEHFQDYRSEAVVVALAELDRRGLDLSNEERARIREGLGQRDAAAQAQLNRSFVTALGNTLESRLARIRVIVTLEEVGPRTRLSFCMRFGTAAECELVKRFALEGNEQTFDRLAALLAEG